MPSVMHEVGSSYDPLLVALSYLIAVGASFTALDAASRVAFMEGRTRIAWLLGGAATMGMAIWSMHFTGMLAFSMAMPHGYDIALTFLSMVVAIAVSGGALAFVGGQTIAVRPWLVPIAGIIMGLGIAGMHYTGMAAMRMDATLSYDQGWFVASIVVAIVAAIGALALAFYFRQENRVMWSRRKFASALVMGFAICGMHYTGMAAARFHHLPAGSVDLTSPWIIRQTSLGATAIVVGTVIVLAIALLNSYREALQREHDLLKDHFLGLLSHELRTPLNAIVGFGSILQDEVLGPLNAKQKHAVERMLGGSTVMLSLVNDLLDLTRMQAGRFTLDLGPIAIQNVINETISAMKPLFEERKHRIIYESLPEPPIIRADDQRITQILMNLLGNAIKYTPDGGTIRIRTEVDGAFVRVAVEDNGLGIAAEDQPKLFKPFAQLDPATSYSTGAGLGLSIVKGLVEAHGGTVGVRSEPGAGSCFWFTMPIEGGSPREPERRADLFPGLAGDGGQGPMGAAIRAPGQVLPGLY